jgi:hypothetical protein
MFVIFSDDLIDVLEKSLTKFEFDLANSEVISSVSAERSLLYKPVPYIPMPGYSYLGEWCHEGNYPEGMGCVYSKDTFMEGWLVRGILQGRGRIVTIHAGEQAVSFVDGVIKGQVPQM